jgi:excisionase family DNA binding protein
MTDSEWVSLREAADILGVHPATVRNWADDGKLPSLRTPGGHRRFRRADLAQYAAKSQDTQPFEAQALVQNALWHTRMRVGGGSLADDLPWYESLGEPVRAQLRQQGLSTMEALRSFLADGAPPEQLETAAQLGHSYATLLRGSGIKLTEAVRGFFYFNDPLMNSILTGSDFSLQRNSPAEWGGLMRGVMRFINHMLLAIVDYYETR